MAKEAHSVIVASHDPFERLLIVSWHV